MSRPPSTHHHSSKIVVRYLAWVSSLEAGVMVCSRRCICPHTRQTHSRKLAQARALAAAAHIEQVLASAQADVQALVQVAEQLQPLRSACAGLAAQVRARLCCVHASDCACHHAKSFYLSQSEHMHGLLGCCVGV